jgi:hypothetical protein
MRLPPPAMVNGTCEGPAVAGASQLGRSSNRLRAQRRSLMARVQAQLCVRLIAVVSGAGACPPMPGGRSPLLHHPLSLSNVCWSARPGERFNHTVVYYGGIYPKRYPAHHLRLRRLCPPFRPAAEPEQQAAALCDPTPAYARTASSASVQPHTAQLHFGPSALVFLP